MGEITPEAQDFKMPKSTAKLSRRRTRIQAARRDIDSLLVVMTKYG